MGDVDDPAEQAVAAAAINTVQLMCGAFGAGLAGVVVNLRESADANAARWMFGCSPRSPPWASGVLPVGPRPDPLIVLSARCRKLVTPSTPATVLGARRIPDPVMVSSTPPSGSLLSSESAQRCCWQTCRIRPSTPWFGS
jgi:hypothetical protein